MLLILHLSSVWLTCHIKGCYVRLGVGDGGSGEEYCDLVVAMF